MIKFLKKILLVCHSYDVDFRKLAQAIQSGTAEDLGAKIQLVLSDLSYNVQGY